MLTCGLLPVDCYNYKSSILLKSVNSKCVIKNLIANFESEFIYYNQSEEPVEASFVFPLQGGSLIHGFEAAFNGKKIVGSCKEINEAKNIYETAKEKKLNTAYIDRNYKQHDVFNCKIGEIAVNCEVKIRIYFSIQLKSSFVMPNNDKSNRYELCLPLILKTRYSSHYDYNEPDDQFSKDYKYSLNIKLNGTRKIIEFISDFYMFDFNFMSEDQTKATAILKSDIGYKKDLEISIEYESLAGISLFYEIGDYSENAKAFFKSDVAIVNFQHKQLQFNDNDFDNDDYSNKKYEIVFIVDRSGSMSGSNIKHAKECLLVFLKSLPDNCKFQIYGFGSNFDKAFDLPNLYDESSMSTAMSYYENIDANMGGTEILSPLKDMYSHEVSSDYLRLAFLLTDGDVDDQNLITRLVRKNQFNTRLYAVGIGDGASTSLVEEIAMAGQGDAVFVRDNKNLRMKVMGLLDNALKTEVINDVKFELENKDESIQMMVIPTKMPTIVTTQFVTFAFIIKGLSESKSEVNCILSGKIRNSQEKIEHKFKIIRPTKSNDDDDVKFTGHRILAKLQADNLMNELELLKELNENNDKNEELKKQIIQLSLEANIISDYTAFVAVEESEVVTEVVIEDIPPPCLYYDDVDMQSYCLDMPDMAGPVSCYAENIVLEEYALMRMGVDGAYSMDAVDGASESDQDECEYDTSIKEGGVKNEETEEDLISQIARFQNIRGFWDFNENLLKNIGMTSEQFTDSKPESSLNSVVWMTMLICGYLEKKMQDEMISWKFLVKKAKNWLLKEFADKSKYDGFYEKALKIF